MVQEGGSEGFIGVAAGQHALFYRMGAIRREPSAGLRLRRLDGRKNSPATASHRPALIQAFTLISRFAQPLHHRIVFSPMSRFWAVIRGFSPVCDSKRGMEQNATTSSRVRFLGYGACALAGCLWGTGFYWGRLALNEMSVEHMVLYRFLFACVGMAPVVAHESQPLSPHRRRAPPAAPLCRLRRSHPVSAPVPRPGADHCEPRLADGGRHAGDAGRRRRNICRRAAGPHRLACPLRFHGRRGARRARRPAQRARQWPALAGAICWSSPRSSSPWPGFCSARS